MTQHPATLGDEHARVGMTLRGKWTLNAFLGLGGAGAVYAATHRNGKRVAVKILHRALSTSPELVERFIREGYVANRVNHPGVVSVLDDDRTEDGLHFMVMDLLEGQPLPSLLDSRGGALSVGEALAVIDDVLDVLVAAHAQRIVHRDIKPANLFLVRDGSVRVLDFGIARFREISTDVRHTVAGGIMGSPGYMPSEQARGHVDRIDGRTDLWAVGATLYTLWTGKRLHEAETTNESLLQAMIEPIPPMDELIPSAPVAVRALLDRALAFEREERFPDATSMQSALREARAILPGSLPRGEARPARPADPRVITAPPSPHGTAVSALAHPSTRSSSSVRAEVKRSTVLVPVVATAGSLYPAVATRPPPTLRSSSNLLWIAGLAAGWMTLVGVGWSLFVANEATPREVTAAGLVPSAHVASETAPTGALELLTVPTEVVPTPAPPGAHPATSPGVVRSSPAATSSVVRAPRNASSEARPLANASAMPRAAPPHSTTVNAPPAADPLGGRL